MNKSESNLSWHEIGDKLTNYFGICPCQRKLKTIVDSLLSIKDKCLKQDFNFTGSEWLILAIMDKHSNSVLHGVNCEYPIINESDQLWIWLEEIKDNPNLTDN